MINVLGPLALDGSRPGSLPRQQRTVACWLVQRRGAATAPAWLAERLWAGRPPANPKRQLLRSVAALRLAGVDIHTDIVGWKLAPNTQSDTDRFAELTLAAFAAFSDGEPAAASQRVEQALRLWRGSPYPELARHPDALPEIEHLELRHLDLLELRTHLMLHDGVDYRLAAELRALTVAHPYRVRLHHQLAIVLARLNRRAEAVQALSALIRRYERCGGQLLGQTEQLRHQLRSGADVKQDDPRHYLHPDREQ